MSANQQSRDEANAFGGRYGGDVILATIGFKTTVNAQAFEQCCGKPGRQKTPNHR